MFRDAYDVLLLIAAVGFGVGSLFVGWSVLRDRGRAIDAAGTKSVRPHVALELLAWAIPTLLMAALFAAAIRAER